MPDDKTPIDPEDFEAIAAPFEVNPEGILGQRSRATGDEDGGVRSDTETWPVS